MHCLRLTSPAVDPIEFVHWLGTICELTSFYRLKLVFQFIRKKKSFHESKPGCHSSHDSALATSADQRSEIWLCVYECQVTSLFCANWIDFRLSLMCRGYKMTTDCHLQMCERWHKVSRHWLVSVLVVVHCWHRGSYLFSKTKKATLLDRCVLSWRRMFWVGHSCNTWE